MPTPEERDGMQDKVGFSGLDEQARKVLDSLSDKIQSEQDKQITALTAERDELAAEVKRLREALENVKESFDLIKDTMPDGICKGAVMGYFAGVDTHVDRVLNPPEGT